MRNGRRRGGPMGQKRGKGEEGGEGRHGRSGRGKNKEKGPK